MNSVLYLEVIKKKKRRKFLPPKGCGVWSECAGFSDRFLLNQAAAQTGKYRANSRSDRQQPQSFNIFDIMTTCEEISAEFGGSRLTYFGCNCVSVCRVTAAADRSSLSTHLSFPRVVVLLSKLVVLMGPVCMSCHAACPIT